jgi:type I restriction enzyme, S subunit
VNYTTLKTAIVRNWRRYPEYRPSGAEWLPEMPAHWQAKRLKYLASPSRQRLFEKPLDATYIGLEQIESKTGKLLLDNPVQTVESTKGVFEGGDILFGKLRPYLAKVAVPRFAGVCTTELIVYRPNWEVHSDYLKYQMLVGDFIDFVNALTYGTKMPRVSEEQMSELRLVFPSMAEQQAIVAFLDRETTRIDALIGHKERLIALLKEKRQAIISYAVTRGLAPSASLKDSGVDWIGSIPTHWEVKKLKHVCKLETGHTPRKSEESYWVSEDCAIPWISLNDTKKLESGDFIDDTAVKISPIGMRNSAAHLIQEGAVVFNRDGARVGLSAITTKPMCLSQHLIGWVCGRGVSNRYLLHVLYAMEQEIYRLAAGATIPTIGMPDVKEMVMPFPPLREQEPIADKLFAVRSRIAFLIQRIESNIDLLHDYRSALISAAVTGQIDVRGQS